MMHRDIVEIVEESTQKVIGYPQKHGLKKWISDATLTLFTNRDNPKKRYQQKKKATTKEKWRNLAKQVQESYLDDEQRLLETKNR